MNDRNFKILKMRFVDGMSYGQIADKYNKTNQWAFQTITATLEKLYYELWVAKWEAKNNLGSYGEELQDLIFILGKENKDKLIRLITALQIQHPSDFAKYRYKDLTGIKGLGEKFFLSLKLALLKMGHRYDSDDMEEIMNNLKALSEYSSNGMRLRFKILKRDGFRCHYCGKSPKKDPDVVLHVDHIKPISKGGSWDEKNLITSCKECNLGKSDTE